jgi:uncharacterized protein UPF0236
VLPAEASILSMLQTAPDFKTLERELHAAMAAEYRERLTAILTALDTELMGQRPSGLRHGGTKVRTVETRLGPVRICRRRYLETLPTGERRWRYLLDEALGLPPEVRTSPGVQEHAIETALQVSYRRAATLVASAHPEQKGPRHATIHRWLCAVGTQRVAFEQARVQETFEEGVVPPTSGVSTPVLFAEADELYVARQRPKRSRRPGQRLPKRRAQKGEVRLLIGHRGWVPRDPGSTEYRLQDKHVYADVAEAEPFWRGATLSLQSAFALERVQCTVLNGDGASWIRHGLDYLPHSEFQLDRWHLGQAVRAALDWHPRLKKRLQEVLAQGADWTALDRIWQRAMRAAPVPARGVLRELRTYLWENRDGLVDYRQRALPVPIDPQWRGLGAAESNVDKPFAERLTKRGMSWSRGLRPLVRLLTLHEAGTLGTWLEYSTAYRPMQPELHRAAATVRRTIRDDEAALPRQARIPALARPEHPLAHALRSLTRMRWDV